MFGKGTGSLFNAVFSFSRPIFTSTASRQASHVKTTSFEPFFEDTRGYINPARKLLEEAKKLYNAGNLEQAQKKTSDAVKLAEQVRGDCLAEAGFRLPFYKMEIKVKKALEETTKAKP